MDAGRAHKLADRIARIVAEMLERRVKDPRLGFVTVTDARITNDLREATVYYTVYGSAEEQAGTAAALKSATGLIRSEVGRQTGLRHTPSLTFVRDTLSEGAAHLEELVAQARAADEALAAAREGAQPAGDPNPYRVDPDPSHAGPYRVPGGPAGEGDAAGPADRVPEEAYPDQVYPGDPDPGDGGAGAWPLGRGYPAGPDEPGGPGGAGRFGSRRGAARWRR
jgi:ribosome-binding factor A